MNKIFFLFLASLAFLHAPVFALNVEDILQACHGNFITQDFNISWANQAFKAPRTTFYPLVDKYSAYVLTQYLFQAKDFKVITESQLEHSCIATHVKEGHHGLQNLTGYDKSILTSILQPNIPKLLSFHLPTPAGMIGSGYSSVALTDNQNYVVLDLCFENGLRGFVVASPQPYLDDLSLAVITAHLKSLGFKEKNFIQLNYQDCFDGNGDVAPYTAELPIPAPPAVLRTVPIQILGNNFLYPSFVAQKK